MLEIVQTVEAWNARTQSALQFVQSLLDLFPAQAQQFMEHPWIQGPLDFGKSQVLDYPTDSFLLFTPGRSPIKELCSSCHSHWTWIRNYNMAVSWGTLQHLHPQVGRVPPMVQIAQVFSTTFWHLKREKEKLWGMEGVSVYPIPWSFQPRLSTLCCISRFLGLE